MKNFCAKILVMSKPTIKDVKSETLKEAIDCLVPLENLSCKTGSYYSIKFSADNQREALAIVNQIAEELLSNSVVETYEVKSLEEVYE